MQYSLTKEQENEVKALYSPYVKPSLLMHGFYLEKTGKFFSNYMADDLYYAYIDPYYNDWEEAKYMDNKCLYGSLLKEVLQPETFAMRMNGFWFDANGEQLSNEKLSHLLDCENRLFVKKASESYGGFGIVCVEGEKIKEQFWDAVSNMHGDVIVQKPILQHEALCRLNASSVNTIRSISLLSADGVKVYSSFLRLGVNGKIVDNASSGGLSVGIDSDGCLKTYGYSIVGERYLEHPDSHTVFDGYRIPGFEKIMELIPKLHNQIPHFRLVSWDFTVREDGEPILVEVNLSYGGIQLHQLNNGPLFGDDTEKILKEVFS